MASHVLISWIGQTDLRASQGEKAAGLGPVAQALDARAYDEVQLLYNYPESEVAGFLKWLRKRTRTPLNARHVRLSSPTHFGEIHVAAVRAIEQALESHARAPKLTFHLSPGTPAMAAIWIILAKTRFPAELIESSRERGVRIASVPFDMSADYLPDLLRGPDERLERLSAGLPPEAPEFADIVHRSTVMKRLVAMARLVAPRSVPVLIEGESGTGKELMARAIHRSSPRRDKPFVAVNCGAIPAELVESHLFGHEKGSFTGANAAREGFFEAANGGTLFLDEVGELPQAAQVKMLRALQESEIVRVGATKPVKLDLRIIAATNRNLIDEVRGGRFREDLFYRLAVAVLKLPPLSARTNDVGLLIDHFLHLIHEDSKDEPGFKVRKLSAGARNLLLAHAWPGNVRELHNTLRRAAIWTTGETIGTEDVREALLDIAPREADVLGRSLGQSLSLAGLMDEVARHYLSRALTEARGNKSEAARLVGLPSYQTFTNWMRRYGVEYEAGGGEE
jgi:DNA-binding NtrC family response regulator